MNFFWGLLLVLASCFSDLQVTSAEDEGHFVNSWAAEIVGGEDVARDVAEQHGYRLVRSLEFLPDHYVLERSDTPHRSRRSADHHTKKLSEDERVLFVEQQEHRPRAKRGVFDRNTEREVTARHGQMDDPEYGNQWYIHSSDSTQNRRDETNDDLNIQEVWDQNITGKGVVVVIVDDGIECSHDDLKDNCDPEANYDYNDNDDDPSPRYDPTNENKHGTRCAGEIAMKANNNVCGVGIAYDCKIGGIRMLDGAVTDTIEASSLSFNRDHISIYSASWGPTDDGGTVEGPGKLTQRALEDGAKKGRGGKGSLFVFASGNGGYNGDSCNADGYVSSVYTMSVSSASQGRTMPYYTERCASTLTTAFSSGSAMEKKVISADLHNRCTDNHSGTSAAAPMAAGILALLLEANPELTYRDCFHIVVHTSRYEPLQHDNGWYQNGAGYCVNLGFGFGLISAREMVKLANPQTWKHVGEEHVCKVEPAVSSGFPREFMSGQSVEVEFNTDGCAGQMNEVNYVESIQVVVDIAYPVRGKLFLELESPSGAITPLIMERDRDNSKEGYKTWPFMTVHNWGERSRGTWKFRVADRIGEGLKGSLNSATLVLYGTKEQPDHQKHIPKRCGHLKQYADTLTNKIEVIRDAGRVSSYHSSLKGHPSPNGNSKISEPNHTSLSKSSTAIQALLQSLSRG